MSFSRHELESVITAIRSELQQQPDFIRENGEVLELCWPQHARAVTDYVNLETVTYHESYVRFDVQPEAGTGWAEIERMELLLPYSSIEAIDRRVYAGEDGSDYSRYRLITAAGLGQFYEADEGYAFAQDEADPTYVESPAATLSRVYGILRKWDRARPSGQAG
jgi:hypothetical protein